MGLYGEAIADYDQALQLDPDHAVTYYHRGNAKMKLRWYKKAITDYDQALQLDPDLAAAYHDREIAKGKLDQ